MSDEGNDSNPLRPRIVVEYDRITRDVTVETNGTGSYLECVAMLEGAKAIVLERWFGRDGSDAS